MAVVPSFSTTISRPVGGQEGQVADRPDQDRDLSDRVGAFPTAEAPLDPHVLFRRAGTISADISGAVATSSISLTWRHIRLDRNNCFLRTTRRNSQTVVRAIVPPATPRLSHRGSRIEGADLQGSFRRRFSARQEIFGRSSDFRHSRRSTFCPGLWERFWQPLICR